MGTVMGTVTISGRTKSQAGPEPEAESKAGPEPEADTPTGKVTESQVGPEPEADTQTETVTEPQAGPEPEEADTQTETVTESQAGMSHFIITMPQPPLPQLWDNHCDDDCPFIVRNFRQRRLRNCKTCTPNTAIVGDAVYFTPTGKCIHKRPGCQYLLNHIRIFAKRCEHCFR